MENYLNFLYERSMNCVGKNKLLTLKKTMHCKKNLLEFLQLDNLWMILKFHESIYDWAHKKCIVGLKYRSFIIRAYFFHWIIGHAFEEQYMLWKWMICRGGQLDGYGITDYWVSSPRDTNFEKWLPKNQHTQGKL